MQLTAALQVRGVTVVPFELQYSSPAQDIITAVMLTETAANFDFWQRSGAAETNRRQVVAWCNFLPLQLDWHFACCLPARNIMAVVQTRPAANLDFWPPLLRMRRGVCAD